MAAFRRRRRRVPCAARGRVLAHFCRENCGILHWAESRLSCAGKRDSPSPGRQADTPGGGRNIIASTAPLR